MKYLFLILLLGWNSLLLQAQAPAGMGKSDAEAKKILDAVSTRFKSYKSVQAKFTLNIENASGKSMGTKSGDVTLSGLRYRISSPGQEILSDGVTVWSYEKASNEVTISKIDPSANAITPQKLFTNFYDKDFLYKLNGTVKLAGKSMQEIELTPVDKSKPFHKVLLYVSQSVIYSTKVFEKNGNRFTYGISQMKTGASVPDQTFVFNPKSYPGVEVVDLR